MNKGIHDDVQLGHASLRGTISLMAYGLVDQGIRKPALANAFVYAVAVKEAAGELAILTH